MPILADAPPVVPTNLAPLPHLLAYAQSLSLERHLAGHQQSPSTDA